MEPYFPTAPKRNFIFRRLAQVLKASQKNWGPLSEMRCFGATPALTMALAMKEVMLADEG